MAYRRAFDSLSLAQRKRYERFFGLNAAFRYETGASLQAARGHKPHEHITRYINKPSRLSSSDYQFLKKKRSGIEVDEGEADPLKEFYKTLTPSQRGMLRDRVRVERRAYIARGKTKLRKLAAYTAELKNDYPWFDDEMIGLAFYH